MEEVATDDFALDVVLNRARPACLQYSPSNALPGAHSKGGSFGREVANTAFHDQQVLLVQHDTANIGRKADLGFVGDLTKNLLEISAFEDAVRHPLEDLDSFQLVRISVFA